MYSSPHDAAPRSTAMPSGPAVVGRLLLLRNIKIRDRAFIHLGGHADGFAERGVRVDGAADVAGFGAHFDGERELGDEVTGVHADDAGADDAMSLFVEQELGEAFGAVDADGAAGGCPGELADADLQTLFLRFPLGHADPGDFRIRIGHRRNHAGVEEALLARRRFGGHLGFVRGLVRQHGLADEVADGEDVLDVGTHLAIDRDGAAVGDFHARLVGANLVAVRRAADGNEDAIEQLGLGNAFAFEGDFDALLGGLRLDDLGLEVDALVTP